MVSAARLPHVTEFAKMLIGRHGDRLGAWIAAAGKATRRICAFTTSLSRRSHRAVAGTSGWHRADAALSRRWRAPLSAAVKETGRSNPPIIDALVVCRSARKGRCWLFLNGCVQWHARAAGTAF